MNSSPSTTHFSANKVKKGPTYTISRTYTIIRQLRVGKSAITCVLPIYLPISLEKEGQWIKLFQNDRVNN